MNNDQIYDQLNGNESNPVKKQVLRGYLVSQVEQYRQQPENAQDIAYAIAGLLSTQAAASMTKEDPYLQALDMAGELELPADVRHETSTWPNFIQLVEQLPEL